MLNKYEHINVVQARLEVENPKTWAMLSCINIEIIINYFRLTKKVNDPRFLRYICSRNATQYNK